MKIYNKKGLVFGILWAAMGSLLLIHALIMLEPERIRQIKDLIVSVLLLAIGITSVVRAYSKKASREDFIEKSDERNQLTQLKTKAKMLDLMIWAVCFLLAVSLIGYMVTENTAWGFLFFGPCLLLIFAWISFIAINLYYEHHE